MIASGALNNYGTAGSVFASYSSGILGYVDKAGIITIMNLQVNINLGFYYEAGSLIANSTQCYITLTNISTNMVGASFTDWPSITHIAGCLAEVSTSTVIA